MVPAECIHLAPKYLVLEIFAEHLVASFRSSSVGFKAPWDRPVNIAGGYWQRLTPPPTDVHVSAVPPSPSAAQACVPSQSCAQCNEGLQTLSAPH